MSSFLSKALKGVVKVGLPIVGTALGGPLGGIAAGALAGAIGSGKPKVGNIVGGAASGALAGYGGQLLGGAGKLGSAVSGGAETAGLSGSGGLLSGGAGGLLKSVGTYALKHPETVLGAVGAISSAKQAGHANDLQNHALDLAQQRYDDLAPLRTAGLDALTHFGQVTPASLGLPSTGNPYGRPASAPASALPLTQPPPLSGITPLRRPARRMA